MQNAVEEARRRGYDGLWLGVWENNARAMRFYEKKGFVKRGEHFFWVGESKRRDLIMEKEL
jgi:ribosomal protein S18 acetylase RimI-like enzyme